MTVLKKIFNGFACGVDWLSKILISIPAILGFFMMSLITVNVVLRYFLSKPIKWEFEVVEDIFIAFVFLGLAYIHSQERYIYVEILTQHMSRRAQIVLKIIGCFAGLVFFGLMTKAGWDYAWPALQTGLVSSHLSRLPVGPVRLLVPIGAGALCLQLLVMIFRYTASLRVKRSTSSQ